MNHSFNNDSLDSGTSHDYAGGHSSDLGYNQHENLNSDNNWQDFSQQHLDHNGGWGAGDVNNYHHPHDSEMPGLTDLHQNPSHQPFESGLGDVNNYQHSHHSEISSLTDLPESELLPTFDSPFDNSHWHHSPEDNGANSYYHQPHDEYSLGNESYSELPQLDRHTAFASHKLNYSDDSVYTIVDNHGYIYKHTDSSHSDWVGNIDGRCVYNTSNHYLGYAGTDGKIYDNQKHCIGWVDRCGHVFNASGVEVYKTTKGVVGGAAYMLLVYLGGVN